MRVVVFPWLAHGHITPFMELAKKLTKRNVHVYVCTTPSNISYIKASLTEHDTKSIEFVELHLPPLPELPPGCESTKNFPADLLVKALDMTQPEFSDILKTLKPDLVIYDGFQTWAATVASVLNIPAIGFQITGAISTVFLLHCVKNSGENFPFPGYVKRVKSNNQPTTTSSINNNMIVRYLEFIEKSCSFVLINSFMELEAKLIDYLSCLANKRLIPIGPIVKDINDIKENDNDDDKEIMAWLDNKEKGSVVFVSFGSECFLTRAQFRELALGLEQSKVKFIWVMRFSPREEKVVSLDEVLPEGFLTKVRERGLLIQNWAPQDRILAHSSTGGVLIHCGWNSVLETLKHGLPIVALPMQYEQPMTAAMLKDIGVCVEVPRDEDGNFEGKEVAKLIRDVILEKNAGDLLRRRARELSDIMNKKANTEKHIDDMVHELAKLCAE